MATETAETTTETGLESIDSTQWLAGAAGGVLGSVLFGGHPIRSSITLIDAAIATFERARDE